jgi:hypothetical protein
VTVILPKRPKLPRSPATEIRRLNRRLKRLHKREREAIVAGNAPSAIKWGMLAGETWGRMVQLAEDHNLDHVLPAQNGPLLKSQ